jgi:RNase H-fold protein (predicted Holliday junction resolvase)
MTVLGISIGTSRTGVCILKDGILLDRQVHDYPTLWSDNKLRIILNRYRRYLHKYPVTDIIIKIPPTRRHTGPLQRLIRRTEALAKEYNCEFDLITKDELKQPYSLRSTEEIIKFTRLLYPELNAYYEKGIASNHIYHKKLYEAVLAAHIYNERFMKRQTP